MTLLDASNSAEVLCVTLHKDNCVHIPCKYIEVWGYRTIDHILGETKWYFRLSPGGEKALGTTYFKDDAFCGYCVTWMSYTEIGNRGDLFNVFV